MFLMMTSNFLVHYRTIYYFWKTNLTSTIVMSIIYSGYDQDDSRCILHNIINYNVSLVRRQCLITQKQLIQTLI